VHEPPFDILAADYDRRWADTPIGRLQRRQVWRRIDGLWRPGEAIVELGCGTGIDAEYLAGLGVRVLATDPAPAMVAQADRRCRSHPLVETAVLAAEQVGRLSGRFDGAFSNFAALNCVLDLDSFAAALAERLLPGARAAFCLFGRRCLWELAVNLMTARPDRALRRLRRGVVEAAIGEGRTIRVRYWGETDVRRAFADAFDLVSVAAIGLAVPPTTLNRLVARLPGLLSTAQRLDLAWGSHRPLVHLGDHTLYVLRRR